MSHEQGDRGERHYETIGDGLLSSAALDRLTHHSHTLIVRGHSFRQRERRKEDASSNDQQSNGEGSQAPSQQS